MITALPTPPSRQDPTNFATRADDFLGSLPQFVTEANALEAEYEAAAAAAANAVLTSKVTGPASATDNTLPRFDGATGKLIQGSGVAVDDSGNLMAAEIHAAVAGNAQVKLERTGASAGVGYIGANNTAALMVLDSSFTELLSVSQGGNLTLSAGALGYGAGAGGTVTQATDKSTPVTINKPNGQITTAGGSLAAGGVVTFQVNNSFVAPGDGVLVTVSNLTLITYEVFVGLVSSGAFYISLRNFSAGSLSEAVKINFQIIKGSNS